MADAAGTAPVLAVVNPLAAAMRHYETQVIDTLRRIGRDGAPMHASAPIDSASSLPARSLAHLRLTRTARRSDSPVLVVWPGFGYFEPALWRAARADTTLLIHDPAPLRRQRGSSWVSRRAGGWGARGPRVRLACHTHEAARATAEILDVPEPPVMLHPIRTAGPSPSAPVDPAQADLAVVVAGQYKPARDLDLLAALGPVLRRDGIRARIVGRGWPDVPGWERRDGFLSEEDFRTEIRQAAAVLLPYRRYWQSGVAIQALEADTPVVGYRTEFLTQLFGAQHAGFVSSTDRDEWLGSIRATIERADSMPTHALRAAYQSDVDRSWRLLTEERSIAH